MDLKKFFVKSCTDKDDDKDNDIRKDKDNDKEIKKTMTAKDVTEQGGLENVLCEVLEKDESAQGGNMLNSYKLI